MCVRKDISNQPPQNNEQQDKDINNQPPQNKQQKANDIGSNQPLQKNKQQEEEKNKQGDGHKQPEKKSDDVPFVLDFTISSSDDDGEKTCDDDALSPTKPESTPPLLNTKNYECPNKDSAKWIAQKKGCSTSSIRKLGKKDDPDSGFTIASFETLYQVDGNANTNFVSLTSFIGGHKLYRRRLIQAFSKSDTGPVHMSYVDVSRVSKIVHPKDYKLPSSLNKIKMKSLLSDWESGAVKVTELPRPKNSGWSYSPAPKVGKRKRTPTPKFTFEDQSKGTSSRTRKRKNKPSPQNDDGELSDGNFGDVLINNNYSPLKKQDDVEKDNSKWESVANTYKSQSDKAMKQCKDMAREIEKLREMVKASKDSKASKRELGDQHDISTNDNKRKRTRKGICIYTHIHTHTHTHTPL